MLWVMASMTSAQASPHVVIAGGGFAALESVLALRALAAGRVRVTLVSPDPEFTYRPAATAEAFGELTPRSYDLPAIADDLGAKYYPSRLEVVASRQKWVRLGSGARLPYDALVLATGARPTASVAGALTFRDRRDVALFRGVLQDICAGRIRRVVFAVPTGRAWQLPLYELALLSATEVSRRDLESDVTIVSPEHRPLQAFGAKASALVQGLLAERGVRFLGDSATKGVRRDGLLLLDGDRPIEADRVVATPELRGRPITGIPADWSGFVPTDAFGRVHGLEDVYAAGDMTAFPIKHGGLATQQADRIAHTIAAAVGAPVGALRRASVLRALLLGGEHPLYLRAELDEFGHPSTATLEHSERPQRRSSTKVFGRYLEPYLEQRPSADLSDRTARPVVRPGAESRSGRDRAASTSVD
jgi:sulfide:quinone oxidoreductase